jgi:hypothetical protein
VHRHHKAARRAHLTSDAGDGQSVELRFGEQLDTRVLASTDDGELHPGRVAAYVAKYSTKASHEQITTRHSDPAQWCDKGVPDHLVELATAAPHVAERFGMRGGLGRWVHMLDFRGHFVTKSHRFSTTLSELRNARATYRANQNHEPDDSAVDGDHATVVLSVWEYIGSGYLNPGDAMLAAGIEASLDAGREAPLDLRCGTPP